MRDEPTDADDPAAGPLRVLELRIHGVNNTTPADMLELGPDQVRQIDGDALGSFWAPDEQSQEDMRRTDPDNPGVVPPRRGGVLEREAYSWGGLARTSVTVGSGTVGHVVAGVARLGWALLLPLGLVNIAYWTRRLDTGPHAVPGQGRGAAASRLFGLLLTVLLVVTACEVALDLFAYQCFGSQTKRCAALPDLVDVLAPWPTTRRLALASLLPVLVLVGLRLLGRVSAARYEAVTVVDRPGEERADHPGPLLARPSFWRGAARAEVAARLHLAAGVGVVVLATAVPVALAPRAPGWAPWTAALAGGVVVGAALALARFVGETSDLRDVSARVPLWLVVAAVGLLVVQVVLLAREPSGVLAPPQGAAPVRPLPGYGLAPLLLLTLGAAVASCALTWRDGGPWRRGAEVAARRARSVWAGTAPGVFLVLALATAMMLSSLTVLTTGNWLNGIRSTADLLDVATTDQADTCVDRCAATADVSVPAVYVVFGAASVAAILLLAVAAAVLAVRWWKQGPDGAPTPPSSLRWLYWSRRGTATGPDDEQQPADLRSTIEEVVPPRRAASRWGLLFFEDAATTARTAARSGDGPTCPGEALLAPTARARTKAAVLQHAEVLVLLLVAVAGVAVVAALVESYRALFGRTLDSGVETFLLSSGPAGITLIGAAVAGSVAGGGVLRGQRPLGIVWDLICVVPRAAHPLGPPCYAERAVPEIVRRIVWYLSGQGGDGTDVAGAPAARSPAAGRAVVLSAHSLGCALAVAAINALPDAGRPRFVDQVSLITYGCQLRPYFSRIFPELFGPQILGTPPCGRPTFTTRDPWQRQLDRPATPPGDGSLLALLEGRWLNLWRRTDYLGFPLVGWRAPQVDRVNEVDRPAEEIDTATYVAAVATHGNYPRTIAYGLALRSLVPGIDDSGRARAARNYDAG